MCQEKLKALRDARCVYHSVITQVHTHPEFETAMMAFVTCLDPPVEMVSSTQSPLSVSAGSTNCVLKPSFMSTLRLVDFAASKAPATHSPA